jgi:hypothetical protein
METPGSAEASVPPPAAVDAPPRYRISFSRSRLPARLMGLIAGLIALHLGFLLYRLAGHELLWDGFNLRAKLTVPNFYSAFALLFVAILLLAIAVTERGARSPGAWHWYGLAAGFTAMSIDRIACVHQLLNTFSTVSWEVPGAVLVAVIGLLYIPFLARLPRRTRAWFLISGTVYVFGVIVLEALENVLHLPAETPLDGFLAIPDEGFQMAGVALFAFALLDDMRTRWRAPALPAPDPARRPEAGRGADAPSSRRFELRPLPIAAAIVTAALALFLVNLAFQRYVAAGHHVIMDLHMVFDFDQEPSIPSWLDETALLAAAALLFVLARDGRRGDSRGALGAWVGGGWLVLLALDRTAVLHDWVTMNVSIDPVWLRGAFALVGAVALVLLAPRLGARARVVAVTAWVLLVIGPIIETVATETLPPAAAESLAMNLVIATELALRTMAGALLVFAFLDTMRSPGAVAADIGVEVVD